MKTNYNELSKKLCGMLGLSARARKLICGSDLVCDTVRSGKTNMVLVAFDASANTKKRVFNCCIHYECECREIPVKTADLAHSLGKKSTIAAVALTDPHMAKGIRKVFEEFDTVKDTADRGSREV